MSICVCVLLYDEAFGEAIVKEVDLDTGELVNWAGFHILHTSDLHDLKHIGPAPEPIGPLDKDH